MKYLATLLLILGFGISAFGQTIKSLGYNTTNGQVVANTTNAITFTNTLRVSGTATNVNPQYLWQTYDGVGNGGIIVQSRSQLTNLWNSPTNAHTNWSIMWLGQNIVFSQSQSNVVQANTNMGAAYLSIENAYNYDGVPTDPSSEIYFTVIGQSGGSPARPFTIRTAFTNTEVGEIGLNHGTSINPKQVSGQNVFAVNFSNPIAGNKNHLNLYNADTNNSRDVRFQMAVGTNALIWSMEDSKAFALLNLDGNISYPFLIYTNGVVIGATGAPAAQARVHLAGNTRVDGAISFNATSNAETTRTNLGLGSGITTNRTFVSYDGTNYTTNTVTISNGIITGWTQ